jgi:hypothetical protein
MDPVHLASKLEKEEKIEEDSRLILLTSSYMPI